MDSKAHTLTQVLKATDAHDLDGVRGFYAPDARIVAPGADLDGIDQIIPWYRIFITAFPDLKHEIRATIEQDATCVVQARATGTHTGPLPSPAGDIPPTGKSFVLDYVDLARFEEGRIKSETYYWDNQSFQTQLGLV